MKIAIPTYNRPELKAYDLACQIVGKENVFVFFHNEEDRAKYSKDIHNAIITNTERGIGRARNAILDYFKLGEQIIMMDDDISEVYGLLQKKLVTLTPSQIKLQFHHCFDVCEKSKAFLWGVYPVKNEFFMKDRINNKSFIIGWIMGIIVNELRFDETMPTKEDYDYAIQNLVKYKKVARFDYLTCNAKYQAKGGLDYVYGTDKERQAREMLLAKWNIVKENKNKDNEVYIDL